MYSERPLFNMPYAHAKVIEYDTGEKKYLRSYNTIVAGIDSDGFLSVGGLYSRTTMRHLSSFARELGLNYYILKHLYLNNLKLNIKTGEEVPL